ncbi:FAD dependent oxidoreductase [Aspergillus neoniger CBS 115656]|uniref:FAD dependent oxidoreductase n=1 Tax=Aspergillus neoniger (strain CBS 115656) TaxID=1448310 RepID=A0A318YK19_ASPNB|nr:FAD dependent oxidoreductase [Aspergillus neoniger CBS 115656]PYH28638.1 FAD dependent oxidoreductase [Aspergillus neoniger CBS 115656]
MHLSIPSTKLLITLSIVTTTMSTTTSTSPMLTRDVCIIGGGAAGTYAAIRLQQLGKSVVVIDHKLRLGGQTTTYTNPAITPLPIEYGVTYYQNMSIVRDFFGHFNIPLTYSAFDYKIDMFDFVTGTAIPATAEAESNAAMDRYIAQMREYPYLRVGLELPDPVPEDLVMPFGEFVDKYDLEAGVGDLGGSIDPLGNWPDLPTLYVMKYANLDVLEGDRTGFVRPKSRNNSELYGDAEKELGEEGLLLGSKVVSMDRDGSADWVYVTVRKGEEETTVQAKSLVVAVQPSLDSLKGFDLGVKEKTLFGQFNNLFFYTALVRVKGLPDRTCYMNRGANDPFLIPQLPGMLVLKPTEASELKVANYLSTKALSEEEVKQGMLHDMESIHRRAKVDFPDPEFLAIGDHSPYQLTVPAEAIENGFYRDLNSLQGERRTFYTAATWESHSTPQIWEFTEQMLQSRLLKSL